MPSYSIGRMTRKWTGNKAGGMEASLSLFKAVDDSSSCVKLSGSAGR